MELFVIRHAKAFDRDAAQWPDDALRPLTREGAREFERVAKRLGRWRPSVDLVLSSGWTRAWETAQVLRARAGWPKPVRTKLLECDDVAGLAALVEMLEDQPADASIALVGHEPLLGALVAQFVAGRGGARIALRKGAVAWLRGAAPQMELHGLLAPGMLRAH